MAEHAPSKWPTIWWMISDRYFGIRIINCERMCSYIEADLDLLYDFFEPRNSLAHYLGNGSEGLGDWGARQSIRIYWPGVTSCRVFCYLVRI
jgi:hypothetical protein